MKCYTIQNLNAWEEAKIKGYLTGDRKFVDKDFLSSYTWMVQQMGKRIDNYNNELPVWLWLDTANICFNELLDGEWVLLEVELSEDQVLLSNFEAWNFILNDKL